MQMHKRNTHSKGASNLAVNRAHKRANLYTGPNRAERREFDDVKGRYQDKLAREAANVANNDTSVPV